MGRVWTGKDHKDELNRQRFLYPLEQVGWGDAELAKRFSDDFFSVIPTKAKLMPHAREVLDYLSERYNLYILSNGFQELQCHKMRSAGIDGYFRKVVLSDDIGVLKPHAPIFHFALSATQSYLEDSLMVGDNWEMTLPEPMAWVCIRRFLMWKGGVNYLLSRLITSRI